MNSRPLFRQLCLGHPNAPSPPACNLEAVPQQRSREGGGSTPRVAFRHRPGEPGSIDIYRDVGPNTALHTCSRTKRKTCGLEASRILPFFSFIRLNSIEEVHFSAAEPPLPPPFQVSLRKEKNNKKKFFTHLSQSKCICSSTGIYRENFTLEG